MSSSDFSSNEKKKNSKTNTIIRLPPTHCVVPGTNFTVDWHGKTKPEFIHSFLSHAHSDHISGIGSFRLPRILHCTPITGKLMLLKYPKLVECIETHEIGSSFIIDKVKIDVLEANHTPGSAMFLFTLPDGQKILHTGDFRAEEDIISMILKYSPIDNLYIDCTYATANVKFFSRKYCTDFASNVVKEFLATKNGIVLIGTYTLGKEECVVNIAKENNQKIFPCKERQDSIDVLVASKWCDSDLFTKEPDKAKIHLVPIQNIRPEFAIEYAQNYAYDSVLCLSLTGWNGKYNWKTPVPYQLGSCDCLIYNIPYSDHSSQEELISFVKTVQPKKLTPTTAFNEKETSKIHQIFLPYIRKKLNKSFIEFYAQKK